MKMIAAHSEVKEKPGTLDDLLGELDQDKQQQQPEIETNGFDHETEAYEAEIIDDGETSHQSEFGEIPDNEDEYSVSDKDLANLLAIVIDVCFSAIWGFWAKEDSREYRLDAKARKDIAKAAIPLMVSMKEQLSPEWLFVVTVLALQFPNAMKAMEHRKKNQSKKQSRSSRTQAQPQAKNTDIFQEVEIQEEIPGKKFGKDGKKHPKVKTCSICGAQGHTKPTCPDNPKNKNNG